MREYHCTWLHRETGLAVARFELPEGAGGFATPVVLPPGSVSDGYFWTQRDYSVYRMKGPGGQVVAHRFDAVANVVIDGLGVQYDDLVLDWWVLADGTILEEDADELAALARTGQLDPALERRAEATALQLFSRYRHIIDGLDALERKLGLTGPSA
ncbi:MAG: hypothetical protein ACKVVT_12080 [Dehalococcoidia bacterium]